MSIRELESFHGGAAAEADVDAPPAGGYPGKRSLVDRHYGAKLAGADRRLMADLVAALRGRDERVQAREGVAPELPAAQVRRAAAAGVAARGGAMPHLDAVQAAFGRHRLDGVGAHVGGAAAEACEQLGASAYAYGDAIAFRSSPDLHTAAHEATHVLQQRAGVALADGVGRAGDRHEQQADEVADAVVAGRRAEPLLDAMLGAASSPLVTPAVQRQQADPACGPGAPVARGDLSALRTAAQGYIGDYFSAAQAGLLAFESDLDSSFDWSAFWVAVGGNVVWACASFATGGTAFVISIAGIAISTAAAASTVTSAPSFRAAALVRLNEVTTHLNDQIDRVTRVVDAEAHEGGWDDSRTRAEILHRLFRRDRPELVLDACGRLPNVNQPAIAASVRERLLLEASQQSDPHALWRPYRAAHFEEVYECDAIEYVDGGMGATPVLRPQTDWGYVRRSAQLVGGPPALADVNASMNQVYDAYGSGSRIDAARWPIEKRLTLVGPPPFGVTYVLDAGNALVRTDAPSFRPFLEARGIEPARYLSDLLALIQGHARAPVPLVSRLHRR